MISIHTGSTNHIKEHLIAPDLTTEQHSAIRALLSCEDPISIFKTSAGTGSAAMLREIMRGLHAGGLYVTLCAPNAIATDSLRHDGFSDAVTLRHFVAEHHHTPGSVIILDEASIAWANEMHALVGIASAHGCRLILCCDSHRLDLAAARLEGQTGQWFGLGAAILQLNGPASREHFESLCQNCDPLTGKRLTPHRNDPSAHDLCIYAPKAVSILARVLDDSRILDAHASAVADTLREVEALAMTRVHVDGTCTNRSTGNLAGGTFTHFCFRNSNLHTHCTFFAVTFDPCDRQWKPLDPGAIFAHRATLSDFYLRRLQQRLDEIGHPPSD
jgi:hypothetical protein